MSLTQQDIEAFCEERAAIAARKIQKFLLSMEVPSDQPLLVVYLGTGWKVFKGFEGCERISLEQIDLEFEGLPEVKDHPNELVYVPDFAETGAAALVLRGRPHLYQKWFHHIVGGRFVEVSAKYLVRLHTEMILELGLMRAGRVGPFIITSATGTLDAEAAPVGSIFVVLGYNSLGLDLPIQSFTVARGALCHDLRHMALRSGKGIKVCLDGENQQALVVRSGGLKVILGPGFEDPQFELLNESDCQAVGMSGPTACHVIRGFNLKKAKESPDKVTRVVHLCLVTDDPYKQELIKISPFVPDSPWGSMHDNVLKVAKNMEEGTRHFLMNLVEQIMSNSCFD